MKNDISVKLYNASKPLFIFLFMTAGFFWLLSLFPIIDNKSGFYFHRLRAYGLLFISIPFFLSFLTYYLSSYSLKKATNESGHATAGTIEEISLENFILFKLLKIKYHYVSHRKTHKIQRNKITLASPSIPFSQTVSIIFHPEVPDIHKVDLSSNFISSQFLTTFIPLLFSVGGIYIGYISVVDNFYIPGKVLLFLILGLMAFAFAFRLIWDFKEFQEEEEESKYRYNPSENNFSGIDLKNAIEKEKEDISISLDETHSKNKNVNIPNFRMTLGNGNENLKVLFSTISIGLGLLFWGLGALLIVNWNAEIYYELFVIIVFGIGLIVYGANYRRNHEESFVAINSKGIAAHIREKVEVDISKDVGIRNLGILKLLFVKRSYTSFEFKWVEIKNIDFGTSEIQIHTKYNTKRIVPLSQLTYSKKNKIKSAIREAIRNSKENQSLTA